MEQVSVPVSPAKPIARRTVFSNLIALLAVAKKEWIIFTRYPTWVIAMVIWPVIFPLGYIFTAKALGGPNGNYIQAFERLTGTGNYVGYIILGTAMWMWLNITLWDLGFHIREEQMRGTLESNWVCPVSGLSIVVGASFAKLASSLVMLIITAVEFGIIFNVNVLGGNIGLMIVSFLLVMPSIYGVGILFASLVIRFKEANAMVFLVRGMVMVFCGITYPIAVLPHWMGGVAEWIPLTYTIRDLRAAVLQNASFADVSSDLWKMVVFAVVLPILGCASFLYTERRARRTGVLSQY